MRLAWTETGGPLVAAPPQRTGFGSQLLTAAVRGQLGGELSMTWGTSGLACELRIPAHQVQVKPGDAASGTEPPTAVPASAWVRAGLRVLIGEDEPVLAMDLASELAKLGCEVVAVAAMVGRLRRHAEAATLDVDLAVLDVNLAGQASFPVADALLAKGVPIIFATGYGDLPNGRWTGHPQVVLLRKPLDPAELSQALARLMPLPGTGKAGPEGPPAGRIALTTAG